MAKVLAAAEHDPARLVWRTKNVPSNEFMDYVERGKANTVGARFRRSDKTWTAPLTVANCHGLRIAYGDELRLADSLKDWYLEHKTQADDAATATAATDAELPTLAGLAPALYGTLRPDQRAGARYVADTYRGAALVADKPGLGKTLETIAGVLEADVQGPVLVVCPRVSVRAVWWREITKWTDEPVYFCRGTRAQREKSIAEFQADPATRKWLIVVQEMLRVKRKPNETSVKANAKKRGRVEGYEFPQLFEQPWATVICDESQKLLGSLTVAKSNLAGEGLAKLPVLPDLSGPRRIAMSGTPFGKGGRVQGMFGTLHWLWPDEYTSFWRWVGDYFETEDTVIGRGGKTAKKILGPKRGVDAETFMKDLGPRILRRTKEEVLPNLPPKQYVEVLCEMTPAQLKQYRQLGDDAEVSVDGGVIFANGPLAEMTRAKQIANGALAKRGDSVTFVPGTSGKVERFLGMLEARGITDGSGDTKVIVSSRFNEFINTCLVPELESAGIAFHKLVGATTERERDRQMAEFQAEGGPRVFILNAAAGGVSITLDAADEVHCLDELDNPEENEQLEDRAHRASRIHQVTIFYYRSEGTIDVNIAESVEDKRQAQFAVLDGRRGLADVRSWIKYRKPKEK